MSVRLLVLSALTAVSAFPAAIAAQERQPLPRKRVYVEGDEPQMIRERIRAITQRRARLGVSVDMRASDADSIGATIQRPGSSTHVSRRPATRSVSHAAWRSSGTAT